MKTLATLLALLLVLAIALAGWMVARPNPAASEVARLQQELQTAKSEIARLQEALTAAPSKKPAPAATPSALDTASSTGTATPGDANQSPAPAKPPRMTSAMRQMLDTPGMKEMMKQQSLVQIDMLYARLFDEFQLNPEERENFRQLLAARTAAQQELGLKLMAEETTDEQRRRITADYDTAKKASDQAIRTFLSHDSDYQRFQYWEESAPERMQFEMMGGRSHFATAGQPLTPAQEEQLIGTMVTVRNSPSDLPDLAKPENLTPGNLSDDMITRQLQRYDHSAQTIAQQAAAYLSPVQLEGLAKFIEQQRAMTEMGLKMSNSMMKADP